jgi:cytochrome P450
MESSAFPVFEGDLFAEDRLADSYATFRTLRDLGEAVWVPRLNLFAVTRFKDVQAALRAPETLVSGRGVAVNPMVNDDDGLTPLVSTITSDGELHRTLKKVLTKPLMSISLQPLRERITAEATSIIERCLDGHEFEAMSTLASHVPFKIVADMVGLKGVSHRQLTHWGEATFNAFGPPELARTAAALPVIQDFLGYGMRLTRDDVVPGGWADSLFLAQERGDITLEMARNLLFDYALPALDTTILATGEMLIRLATEPGAIETIRSRPALVPGVVNEIVRLATPLRGFTRYAARDFELTQTTIPAGSRVWMINAAANRDERHYQNPDQFDIERNPRDHLGWGHGVHLCAGIHLARMELEIFLEALVTRVGRIAAGVPTRLVNNSAHGYATLPLRLERV